MTKAVVLANEIKSALANANGRDPVELMESFMPRLERGIELSKTPEEANEYRTQAAMLHDYIRGALPRLTSDRRKRFEGAFAPALAYVDASRKAGALWKRVANKRRPGGDQYHSQNFANALSSTDAGFLSSQDATICERLSDVDDEDYRVWKEDAWNDTDNPTLHSLYRIWMIHNGGEDEGRPWLRVYQIWQFAKIDDRFGQVGYPGQIPGQIIQNLNYYYTQPGDLVVDLFGGGGTTLDVCTTDNEDYGRRRCEAYDIVPSRPDIIKRDVLGEGIPESISDATLVFLDPPYWKQKRGDYSADENNLANLSLESFHDALAHITQACLNKISSGYVAVIIGPTQEKWNFADHAAILMSRIGVPYHRIQVPYSTQQHGGDYVNKAKQAKRWLYLARDLMIWKK